MSEMIDKIENQASEIADVSAEKKTVEIEVPDLVDMETRIMREQKSFILSAINEKLCDGSICQMLSAPIITDEVARSDIYLTNFSFWRLNRTDFLADVDVRMPLTVADDSGDYDSMFTLYVTLWFSADEYDMECEFYDMGDAANHPERNYQKLDRFLLPIHGNESIERTSEGMWGLVRGSMDDPKLRKPEALRGALKLNVTSMHLANCDDQPYILFFERGQVMVQVESNSNSKQLPPPEPRNVEAGFIVLNLNAPLPDDGDLEIYKACFQYEWHFLFYHLNGLVSTDFSKIKWTKRTIDGDKEIRNPLRIMQIMTEKAGLSIMLPCSIMKDRVFREYRKASVPRTVMGYDNHAGWRYERVIGNIANDFNVAKFRVRQRIVRMGGIEAKGAANYDPDNKVYYPAFGFDPEKIDKNEDFYIKRRQLFTIYKRDEQFRKFMHDGEFAYVDGLVCLNVSDYIEWRKGRYALTARANCAVHDCCLRFVKTYEPKAHGCRCSFDLETYRKKYAPDIYKFSSATAEERKRLKERVIKDVPDKVGEAIQYFMRNRAQGKLSVEKAAAACKMQVSVFKRYCEDSTVLYTLEELINICVGLNLEPWESDILFEKADVVLPRTGPLAHFGFIVDCLYLEPRKNVDAFIEENGFKFKKDKGGKEHE